MISPPFGTIGRPVAVSIYAINGEVPSTPVSLKITSASDCAHETRVRVTSSASATPLVDVLPAKLPDVATLAKFGISERY